MNVTAIRSDKVYQKIMEAPLGKKNDIYRYELMQPFEKKWACYGIPLQAADPNGYDAVAASGMLGHLAPAKVDGGQRENIRALSSEELWRSCGTSIEDSLRCFEERGIRLPVRDYLFTILLADPENPYTAMNERYCGDGGIPGYIFAWLVPNQYTLRRLPAALAHEANHNVRFQFIRWRPDVTLGEMLVSEGLAENFAVRLHGEDLAGPWVTKTGRRTLEEVIKPVIRGALHIQGLENLNGYLYGGETAAQQNLPGPGLPYCAGYACGYHLVRHYLQKTGKSVVEATLLPAEEILQAAEDFWNL